jgi:hypothetical protein
LHLKLVLYFALFAVAESESNLYFRRLEFSLGFCFYNAFLHQTQLFNAIHQSHAQGFAFASAQSPSKLD